MHHSWLGAGYFYNYTFDLWHCVHLDIDHQSDLLWVVSFWWLAQACFAGLVKRLLRSVVGDIYCKRIGGQAKLIKF